MPFLSPNQQCQRTEGKAERWAHGRRSLSDRGTRPPPVFGLRPLTTSRAGPRCGDFIPQTLCCVPSHGDRSTPVTEPIRRKSPTRLLLSLSTPESALNPYPPQNPPLTLIHPRILRELALLSLSKLSDASSLYNTYWLVVWHSGRTSVVDRWTFAVLCSTCSWWVTTYVGKPSAVCQPTRPTQPFIPLGSINEY